MGCARSRHIYKKHFQSRNSPEGQSKSFSEYTLTKETKTTPESLTMDLGSRDCEKDVTLFQINSEIKRKDLRAILKSIYYSIDENTDLVNIKLKIQKIEDTCYKDEFKKKVETNSKLKIQKSPKEILNYYKRKRTSKMRQKIDKTINEYSKRAESKLTEEQCPPYSRKMISTENKDRRTHYSKLLGCENIIKDNKPIAFSKDNKHNAFIKDNKHNAFIKDNKSIKFPFILETKNTNTMVQEWLNSIETLVTNERESRIEPQFGIHHHHHHYHHYHQSIHDTATFV